ncbi:MAG: homoserine O-acetyltransferase [Lentisphaeria bacterium]|nr:homoserine O-acetyltransferase [Lentisphaerota bacterium]MBO5645003.1 homoserine O-acetyltransferase [Lentisphaeria bacterium]MBO5991433.1 homoserine O-acetyltransferase [Lentisphaeria bacterium]MBO7154136.1 homoserine O-acetyltransferase [Lentisphaeria bacterium]
MEKQPDKTFIVQPRDYQLPEPLELDCGRSLKNVNIRYEVAGELNAERTNAILVTHALSGDAHVCGWHSESDAKPGWWDEMIGPGKYIDTNKYCVICSNVIGGCSGTTGPRSIDPDTGKPYNLTFPVVTVRDMVRAQKKLIDHLGIEKLLAVVGGSMGGMQVLQWSVDYPDSACAIVPIATASHFSPQNIAFDWVAREAIKADPEWKAGEYEDDAGPTRGLGAARMLAHITYLSEQSMSRKFGRTLQNKQSLDFDFNFDFAVESYLEYQGRRFCERFDANSYCYITRATDYFDVAADTGGDIVEAFKKVKADFLVVSFSSDWLFSTAQSRYFVNALLKNKVKTSFCEVKSDYGHDAFLLEVDTLGRMVRDFLYHTYEVRNGRL